jgi:hypothetical protein
MSDRRYARIYYDDLEREYPEVWRDPILRGDYTLLLAVADRAWPASPEVPRGARPKAVRRLGELGLIVLEPPYHYRCRGMDKHREERRKQASHAAAVKYANRTADSTPNSSPASTATAPDVFVPNRTEPSTTEPSRADDDGRADLEAFLLVTRRAPTPRQRKLLDSLLDRHDLTGPQWAADIILRNPNDPIGAVIEADKAWRAERIAEAQAAEKPKPQPRRSHGLPQTTRDILAEMQRLAKDDAA